MYLFNHTFCYLNIARKQCMQISFSASAFIYVYSRTTKVTMNAWITIAFLIAVCVIYFYINFNRNLNYFKNKGIPYATGWPLLGNMAATFFRREHISETIVKIYNEHRDAKYIGVFDFMQPVFMLREHDLIKSVTIKNSDSFIDRWSFVDHKLDPFFGGNLLTRTGERWKQSRALLSPAFTSSKMKFMCELIVPCARKVIDYLFELSDSEKKMLDTRELFARYATDVIATCAFGLKVDSVNNPKNNFYTIGKSAANLSGIMTIKFFIARSFPNVAKWLKVKFFDDRVVNFFESIIGNTVNTRDTKGIVRPDMIQLMMNARDSSNDNLKLDITEMTAQAFMFFFGGFDSTTTQLCVIAHELAINPEVQKKLQKEIDKVMEKNEGKLNYDEIISMSYLDAVIKESLRKHPQASVLDRICTKRFELPSALTGGDPITLEPGMRVWIPAVAIHKDPDYFDDPETFNPDRYYEKKLTVNEVTNLGFGIGPRSCIGYRFALLEIKILFVYLLSRFMLLPNEKTCKPLRYSKSTLSVSAEGGFSLAIKPRS